MSLAWVTLAWPLVPNPLTPGLSPKASEGGEKSRGVRSSNSGSVAVKPRGQSPFQWPMTGQDWGSEGAGLWPGKSKGANAHYGPCKGGSSAGEQSPQGFVHVHLWLRVCVHPATSSSNLHRAAASEPGRAGGLVKGLNSEFQVRVCGVKRIHKLTFDWMFYPMDDLKKGSIII